MPECAVFDAQAVSSLGFLVTGIASIVAFFAKSYADAAAHKTAEAEKQADLDREQALTRVRLQISTFVGPLHRSFKCFNTALMSYQQSTTLDGKMHQHIPAAWKSKKYWTPVFDDLIVAGYIASPDSPEAVRYRTFITARFQPLWRISRDLIIAHASDLAELPLDVDWEEKHPKETRMSPYTFSSHTLVPFDSLVNWSYEFDEIVSEWERGIFLRMQPFVALPIRLLIDNVDHQFATAKEKEAKYNPHVARADKKVADGNYGRTEAEIKASERAEAETKEKEARPASPKFATTSATTSAKVAPA